MGGSTLSNKDNKKICCTCGEELSLTNYYKSNSNFHIDGYLPICKKCFVSKFWFFSSEYRGNKKAMQRMCMAFDVYFNPELFDRCDTNDDTVVGNYFRMLNMSQNKGKTYEDSIKANTDFFSGKKSASNKIGSYNDFDDCDENNEITVEDVEKWGVGFDKVDYDVCNAHYKYLKAANPKCDSNQEIFIMDLCYIHMQKMKALRSGDVDSYNKLTESYRKSFNQAGLKTSETMKTDDDCWSVWVDRVSQYTPEEFYKNKERYKDYDGLGEYYDRMAVRPLKNIVFGSQDRDYEYYVHEEE